MGYSGQKFYDRNENKIKINALSLYERGRGLDF